MLTPPLELASALLGQLRDIRRDPNPAIFFHAAGFAINRSSARQAPKLCRGFA